LRYPAQALERAAQWPSGSVLSAAWLICLLHDVGKLASGWQTWARAYQKQIGQPVGQNVALGHTESEWNNAAHEAATKAVQRRHPKPNHAGEGALAVSGVLNQAFGHNEPLVRAAITAIARHHTPFARECGIYALEPQARGHIQATLPFVPDTIKRHVDLNLLRSDIKLAPSSFGTLMIDPSQDYGWLAYTLLARALRRADQEGTQIGSHR
jgi:CRISPR-associated endonuclease/helicase Cas3